MGIEYNHRAYDRTGKHWGDPNCPNCPPDAFPPEESGDENSSSTSKDPTRTIYTVIAETMVDDLFPTGFADPAALSSLSAAEASELKSMFGTPPTTTSTTSSQTPNPGPTPFADCTFEEDIFFWGFIVTGHGWVTDHGDKLQHEESGCRALTGWDWTDNEGDGDYKVKFNLFFIMKEGCVERAIVSAGGPKISYRGALSFAAADGGSHLRYSKEQIQSFASVYAPNTTYHPYTPLDWATLRPIPAASTV